MKNQKAILIFTKVPEPGKVKTRLIPALGEEGAVSLHKTLVSDTLRRFVNLNAYDTYVWIAGELESAWVKGIQDKYDVQIYPQPEGDLGERLAFAAHQALQQYGQVILIGTDCPPLEASHVMEASAAHSEGADIVISPVEDGGYALISLTTFSSSLFDGIHWSTEKVLTETLDRVKSLGWQYRLLETLWDMDRPEDLIRANSKSAVVEEE